MSFGFSTTQPTLSTLFKFTDLSERTQGHLKKVYSTLSAGTLSAFIGCYLSIKNDLAFGLEGVASLLGFLCLLGVGFTAQDKQSLRLGLFLSFGFLQGLSIAPLVFSALAIDTMIVIRALFTTAVIFSSFTISALTTRRRSFLYLGGTLTSVMGFLILSSFFNAFFQSYFVFRLEIIIGLFVFCGYILYDTQLIVEKFERGSSDYIQHAIELFMDLFAIFVRILILLSSDKKERKRDRRE
jgi:FtsH-binding integral membrane protein